MITSTTQYDSYNVLDYKTPVMLIHFDGESVDYVNHPVLSPDNTLKYYLQSVSGAGQRVTPEEGRASISGLSISLLDYDDEITALIATDDYQFQNKKTTVKFGYLGMTEANMLSITGWVSDLKRGSDGLIWTFSISDPQKHMQRKLFRGATAASPVTISGNALNIFLACMISTGDGTEGTHDYLDEDDGLGIDTALINSTGIEAVRDDWFPNSYLSFSIKKPIVALKFFEKEIFQLLNIYPMTDGDGKINVKPVKPPLISASVQEFDNDNILEKIPTYDANFKALINECEFHFDFEETSDDTFDIITRYTEGTSFNNRGTGNKTLTIKSKGLKSSNGGANFITSRKASIFQRWATPPPRITFNARYDRWLSEAGDVVPFTHPLVPDLEAGTIGLTGERMEVINRSPDFKKGLVKLELLATGFKRNIYCVISPAMIVASGTSTTVFDVSAADAAKYVEGWVIDIFRLNMTAIATNLTITDITGTQITVGSSIGQTPAAGMICQFSDYDNLTDDQKKYWALCDGSDQLGTANDDAHLLVA